jgi:hypothetical protein
LIAVVDSRVPPARAKALQAALLKMKAAGGTDTLSSLRLNGFVVPELPTRFDKP